MVAARRALPLQQLLRWLLLGLSCRLQTPARAATTALPAVVVFVSPQGDDTNAGTQAHPLRSVAAARDLVRAKRRGRPQPGNATVWLQGGTYDVTAGSGAAAGGPLQLDTRDSNTTWAAAGGPGQVLLSGGFHVPASQWTRPSASSLARLPPASAHLVRQGDFKSVVASDSMGCIAGAGPPGSAPPWGVCANAQNREIFFGRRETQSYQPGLLARYPNALSDGTWMWETVADPCGTSPVCQTNITAANLTVARLRRWSHEPDLWLQTYFEWVRAREQHAYAAACLALIVPPLCVSACSWFGFISWLHARACLIRTAAAFVFRTGQMRWCT